MTYHESWKPIYFGVKDRGHTAQKRLYLSVEESWRNAVCLLLGFPCITSACLMLLTAGYSMRWVFCSQPVLVRVMALLMSVLASSSSVFSRCICFCFLEALKPVWSCGLNVSDDICLLYHLWTYNLVVVYKCVYLFIFCFIYSFICVITAGQWRLCYAGGAATRQCSFKSWPYWEIFQVAI